MLEGSVCPAEGSTSTLYPYLFHTLNLCLVLGEQHTVSKQKIN
ncbi:conserved hypothetical protein [Sphingobacterium multivorum]|uniref:Uncharacterized protein n=1 Tax=Sphingobacterium multivorum TaxID=28454 RepID=A0A654CVX6_SPHMU|nr:conserved hypothetical protein [Sphingobacterium multivorum]